MAMLRFKQWKCRERSRKVSTQSVIVCIHYRFLSLKETITPMKIYYCRIFHFFDRKNDDHPSQRFEQDVCITMTYFWGLRQFPAVCLGPVLRRGRLVSRGFGGCSSVLWASLWCSRCLVVQHLSVDLHFLYPTLPHVFCLFYFYVCYIN